MADETHGLQWAVGLILTAYAGITAFLLRSNATKITRHDLERHEDKCPVGDKLHTYMATANGNQEKIIKWMEKIDDALRRHLEQGE